MATPEADNARFSVAGQAPAQIGAHFDKYKQDNKARYPVGYKIETVNGDVFRYAHFSTDVNRGVLVSQDISESSSRDGDNIVVAPASAQTTSDGTIGSRYLEMTLASITANQFAGGKLVVTDDTGEGYTYDIIGNTATGDPASGNIRIELVRGLAVALDATSDTALIGSKYGNLEIATAATDYFVAGVTCATMDVSEQAFGWVQTKGVVGILQDNAITNGDQVCISDSISGAVKAQDSVTDEAKVGNCIDTGDSTGHGTFDINVE